MRLWIGLLLAASALAAEPNTLTPAEEAAGWRLLFDGRSLEGWTGMKGTNFPTRSWTLEDGAIRTRESGADGDLVTVEKFESFDLRVDFKISPRGNSGLKYLVQQEWLSPHWTPEESDKFRSEQFVAAVGYEFQIHDDANAPQALESTGALYLLYAPEGEKKLNPPGEWNTARVVVEGARVEHWLNGGKLFEYELGSEEMLKRVAATKFRAVPGFGKKGPGNVVLQHHGAAAWFRNIKIRELY